MATEGEMFLIAVYVDDILLAGKTPRANDWSQSSKLCHASLKWKTWELCITLLPRSKIHPRPDYRKCLDGSTIVHWEHFEAIRYDMQDCKTIRTPVDTLVKAKDEDTFVDQAQYQSAVGSLLYPSTATRPDITYAVSNVAKFCAKPTNGLLWSESFGIWKELRSMVSSSRQSVHCVGFSDADYPGWWPGWSLWVRVPNWWNRHSQPQKRSTLPLPVLLSGCSNYLPI